MAKRIILFGVGSSGLTAEDFKFKLMRIGYPIDAVTNNHFMYMQASLMKEGDVAIGISHTGYSEETYKSLKLAKENGAITIALTHNMRSPITNVSDYVLVNGNRQGHIQGDSLGTRMTQLFVLDLIYMLIVQANKKQCKYCKIIVYRSNKAFCKKIDKNDRLRLAIQGYSIRILGQTYF